LHSALFEGNLLPVSDVRTVRTMSRARFLVPIFAILLTTTLVFASSAQDFLRSKQTELAAIIRQPRSAASDANLVKAFDALLDYDQLAKRSLDAEWGKRSPEEQKEFQNLLRTLVQRAYTKGIRDTLDYDVSFKGEADAAGGKLVKTVAAHKTDKRKEAVQIDYVVQANGADWRVVDIVTEGSSLVSNYRNQFRRVIEQKGFSGLLAKMRTKSAQPE
jgi:phospholipid transport system substrate-binding protein